MGTRHSDERGYFQEVFRFNEDDWMPAQMSIFTIQPGYSRGHHSHSKTSEIFLVAHGTVDYIAARPDPLADKQSNIRTCYTGQVIRVDPGEHHAFYSKEGATLVVLSSRHFNDCDPDTQPSRMTIVALERHLRAS